MHEDIVPGAKHSNGTHTHIEMEATENQQKNKILKEKMDHQIHSLPRSPLECLPMKLLISRKTEVWLSKCRTHCSQDRSPKAKSKLFCGLKT